MNLYFAHVHDTKLNQGVSLESQLLGQIYSHVCSKTCPFKYVIMFTPVIPRQRTRSATTNAEREKTAVKRVGEYFAQISAKRLSVFTNTIHLLNGKCLLRISAKCWF